MSLTPEEESNDRKAFVVVMVTGLVSVLIAGALMLYSRINDMEQPELGWFVVAALLVAAIIITLVWWRRPELGEYDNLRLDRESRESGLSESLPNQDVQSDQAPDMPELAEPPGTTMFVDGHEVLAWTRKHWIVLARPGLVTMLSVAGMIFVVIVGTDSSAGWFVAITMVAILAVVVLTPYYQLFLRMWRFVRRNFKTILKGLGVLVGLVLAITVGLAVLLHTTISFEWLGSSLTALGNVLGTVLGLVFDSPISALATVILLALGRLMYVFIEWTRNVIYRTDKAVSTHVGLFPRRSVNIPIDKITDSSVSQWPGVPWCTVGLDTAGDNLGIDKMQKVPKKFVRELLEGG